MLEYTVQVRTLLTSEWHLTMHPWLIPRSKGLERAAEPLVANGQKAYMRERFQLLGMKAPERRALVGKHITVHGSPAIEELPTLARACWAMPEREYHYIGMELLSGSAKKLHWEHLSLTGELILSKSW